ncbi:MAG TPA: LOG family protein, partial [Dehalococcoidia bacterium]|nr:LOG family protein [Dehalococcoidia bacterium]
TLVCGGRGGIMEAACRGARAGGGHTVGILPGRDARDGAPNPHVEFPIFTGLGFARNVAVVLSGEAVIAIDGAYGTLSEIAYAMIHDIPVVGLDTWDFAYHGHDAERIVRVTDAVEAVDAAVRLAEAKRAAGSK